MKPTFKHFQLHASASDAWSQDEPVQGSKSVENSSPTKKIVNIVNNFMPVH